MKTVRIILLIFFPLLLVVTLFLSYSVYKKSGSTIIDTNLGDSAVAGTLREWKPNFENYVYATPDGIYSDNGILTGRTKSYVRLQDGNGKDVGTAELLLEMYILNSSGNLQTLYFPWILKDSNGTYYSGTYSGPELYKAYGTKNSAFDDWNKYGDKHGSFVLGKQIRFNLAPNPNGDTGPGDPLIDSGILDYWNGREKNLETFIKTGIPGDLIMLGTNVRFGEILEIK